MTEKRVDLLARGHKPLLVASAQDDVRKTALVEHLPEARGHPRADALAVAGPVWTNGMSQSVRR